MLCQSTITIEYRTSFIFWMNQIRCLRPRWYALFKGLTVIHFKIKTVCIRAVWAQNWTDYTIYMIRTSGFYWVYTVQQRSNVDACPFQKLTKFLMHFNLTLWAVVVALCLFILLTKGRDGGVESHYETSKFELYKFW